MMDFVTCDDPNDLNAPIRTRAVKQRALEHIKVRVSRGKTTRRTFKCDKNRELELEL